MTKIKRNVCLVTLTGVTCYLLLTNLITFNNFSDMHTISPNIVKGNYSRFICFWQFLVQEGQACSSTKQNVQKQPSILTILPN